MICLTVGLAACDDGDETELETETAPATGEVAMNAVDIEEVHLGRAVGADMRITDEINDFILGDSVYVSVRLEGTANAASVTARWMTEGDSLVHEETKTISSAGEQWAWFSLGTESLPEGDYELKLLVNGDEDEEREFTIARRDS
jgi:hypothetical protein